ncbi:MAG: DUF167 domain-containing protein [Terriglobales bacterium]
MNSVYRRTEGGITLDLYVQPGASSSCFSAVYNGRLKLRVRAKALEGAANRAVCQFLCDYFALPKSCVTLVSGEKSRLKQVLIEGDGQKLEERLLKLLSEVQDI